MNSPVIFYVVDSASFKTLEAADSIAKHKIKNGEAIVTIQKIVMFMKDHKVTFKRSHFYRNQLSFK